jgi:quinol monooxygenase YgiN
MSQPSDPVVIVATLQPLPGREADVEAACRAAVRAIHTEPGCERFALHRGTNGSSSLVLLEKWSSAATLDEHTAAPAYAELGAQLKGALAGPPEVVYLQPLPDGDERLGAL